MAENSNFPGRIVAAATDRNITTLHVNQTLHLQFCGNLTGFS